MARSKITARRSGLSNHEHVRACVRACVSHLAALQGEMQSLLWRGVERALVVAKLVALCVDGDMVRSGHDLQLPHM